MSSCSRCNASFECGMVDTLDAPCWCIALPALAVDSLPDAKDGHCLCPACLSVWITELQQVKGP